MENASKALIIAGAILLAIIIIGMGVFITNQGTSVTESVNMDDTKIQAYNNKFERYEGKNINGSTVKSLIDTVRTHNNSYKDDVSKQVSIAMGANYVGKAATATNDLTTAYTLDYSAAKAAINTGRTYTVNITYNANTGLVREIGYVVNSN